MLVNWTAIQAVFFLVLLLWTAVIDIKTRTIPDRLSVLIALTALFSFERWNLTGVLAAIPFLCAALTCGGMGGGDVKLMAACGLVLGFSYGMMAQMIGLSLILFYYAVYYLVRRGRGGMVQTSFPLAPFLAAGCIISYVIKLGG